MKKLLNTSHLIEKVKHNVKVTGARIADRHLNLAVTGLSGSGKTAFITSIVNQLLEANETAELPFFSVVREERLIGVKREAQPNLSLRRFAYEQAMQALNASPPTWPESTTGISQVRLHIRYRKNSGLSRYISEDTKLTLDITDYPGEWLLDLPLLEMDFLAWSEHCESELQSPERHELASDFLIARDALDLDAEGDELGLKHVAKLYTDYLHKCRGAGFQLLQPGRFILPGELAGAPVLDFFPLSAPQIEGLAQNRKRKGSNQDLLFRRYEHYQEQVVKPFYVEHFKRFDRQVVLVDCLSALNNGKAHFDDLQRALNWLLTSFAYGKSNLLSRLFTPKIDKLIFAASKADHVTPDQQSNLVKLLDSMLHNARKQMQFDGVSTESTAIAAIRASRAGRAEHAGQDMQILQGTDADGKPIRLFPGDVPAKCPDSQFWRQQGFDFPRFAPPVREESHALPHIRMDRVLEFILGDKIR
ncbi:MAG: ATPase [Alteromonadaceae bacterium]|jgi:predicted YcjX-like family ATPase|nr:ATPase [Alteromonadaceae bacterium]MBB18318.1 ATPase [Rickettsiales bacterium]|tara:strand:+ start:7919 stop:9343 length:1425 start_codon:yes stop_codon:yes gene_type:complete